MDEETEVTLRSLRARNLEGLFAENSTDAKNKILDFVPKDALVGIGDSTTVAQIGVKNELMRRGTRILDGFDRKTTYGSIKDYEKLHNVAVRESTMCDVFLTGTNAVTQDGRLVNVDAAGNRVAGMFWGHPMTVIVVGRNKIVKNLDEAFHRIRKIIAPNHIRIRAAELGGRRVETPCVIKGECSDCRAKDRMCNVFTVIEGKPLRTEIKVVIVNEDLGLGWDESWPPERIAKIIENYKKFVWIPPHILPSSR
jgi:hypothetical protein